MVLSSYALEHLVVRIVYEKGQGNVLLYLCLCGKRCIVCVNKRSSKMLIKNGRFQCCQPPLGPDFRNISKTATPVPGILIVSKIYCVRWWRAMSSVPQAVYPNNQCDQLIRLDEVLTCLTFPRQEVSMPACIFALREVESRGMTVSSV